MQIPDKKVPVTTTTNIKALKALVFSSFMHPPGCSIASELIFSEFGWVTYDWPPVISGKPLIRAVWPTALKRTAIGASLHSFPMVDEDAFEGRCLLFTFPHHEDWIGGVLVGHASALPGHGRALGFASHCVDRPAPIVEDYN